MSPRSAIKGVMGILAALPVIISLSVCVGPLAEAPAVEGPAQAKLKKAQPEAFVVQPNPFFWTDGASILGLTGFGTIGTLDSPKGDLTDGIEENGFEHLGLTPLEGYAICYRVTCNDEDSGAQGEPVFYVGSSQSGGVLPCGANGDIIKGFLFAIPHGSDSCQAAPITKSLRAISSAKTCDNALSIRNTIEWVKGEKRVKIRMQIRNLTKNCAIELLSVKRFADLNVDCHAGCASLDTQCPFDGTNGCVNNFGRTSSSVFASNDPSACPDQAVHAVVMTGSPTPSNTLISDTGGKAFDNLATCDPVGDDSGNAILTGDRTATLHWNQTPDGAPIVLLPAIGKRQFQVDIVYEVK